RGPGSEQAGGLPRSHSQEGRGRTGQGRGQGCSRRIQLFPAAASPFPAARPRPARRPAPPASAQEQEEPPGAPQDACAEGARHGKLRSPGRESAIRGFGPAGSSVYKHTARPPARGQQAAEKKLGQHLNRGHVGPLAEDQLSRIPGLLPHGHRGWKYDSGPCFVGQRQDVVRWPLSVDHVVKRPAFLVALTHYRAIKGQGVLTPALGWVQERSGVQLKQAFGRSFQRRVPIFYEAAVRRNGLSPPGAVAEDEPCAAWDDATIGLPASASTGEAGALGQATPKFHLHPDPGYVTDTLRHCLDHSELGFLVPDGLNLHPDSFAM
ncbi:hypothetical protein J1605_019501, partial [Eschrichtius robustus]